MTLQRWHMANDNRNFDLALIFKVKELIFLYGPGLCVNPGSV